MNEFGNMPSGEPVHRVAISGGGLNANFLTYGTVLQDLRIEGHHAPLVLGFREFAPYLTKSPYFGATAGRCANRIRDGHVELDGKIYRLDRNFLGKHMLHGGAISMGKRLWRLDEHDASSVQFSIMLQNGEMGFPGKLGVKAKFSLLESGVLDIQYTASTTEPTLCNLAHHSYFNLSGEDTILNHSLSVTADSYLPVDDELIPTGEVRPVENTVFDFREAKSIANAANSNLIDHNFCVSRNREPIRVVAQLSSPLSGVTMRCLTTEPGLQVYDGTNISIEHPGLHGEAMRAHAGIALEPQTWPDANHHDHFPSAVLRPGETYRQHTQYVFSKEHR